MRCLASGERGVEEVLSSLEWLMERIGLREEEIDRIRLDDQIEDCEKNQMILSNRVKSVAEVLEDVEVLLDTNFFNEFY